MMNQILRAIARIGKGLPALALVFFISGAAWAADEATLQRMEEIIQKQQAQIEAQARAIEKLQQQVEALGASAVREATVPPKQETAKSEVPPSVVKASSDKMSLKLYGQVNKAFLASDDGNTRDSYIVDNDNSSSRVGFLATSNVAGDVTVGARGEWEYQDNPSNLINQDDKSMSGSLDSRWVDAQITSQRFGKLYIGKGDTASNNTSEVDLSGTSVVGYASVADMAGGLLFYDKNTDQLSGTRIGSVFSDFDGLSRQTRLRYDTPTFGGFYLAGSLDDEGAKDVALNYAAKWGEDFTFAAALAYADPQKTYATIDNQYNGSASILHSSGVSLTVAAGLQEFDDNQRHDATFMYGKVGYRHQFFDFGETRFSLDYALNEKVAQNGDEAESVGLQLVQDIPDWGSEYYLGYRWHRLDRDRGNVDFDDINALMTGVRVKF
jgi:hypothetical protein